MGTRGRGLRFGAIRTESEEAVLGLAGALRDRDSGVRREAALALSRIANETSTRHGAVLDAQGVVIREEEIRANIGTTYRAIFGLVGGVVAAPFAYRGGFELAGALEENYSDGATGFVEEACVCIAATGLLAGVAALLTSEVGRTVDRKRAIQRIRDDRRRKKDSSLGGPEVRDEPYVELLAVAF